MKTAQKVFIIIGICLISIALILILIGNTFKKIKTATTTNNLTSFTSEKNLDSIKNIKAQIAFGKVIIKYGDEFKVEAENIQEKFFKLINNNNYLTIEYLSNNKFEIKKEKFHTPEFTITIPKDFTLENLDLDIGASELKIDSIKAKSSTLNSGAGVIIANDIEFNNLDLKCGVGTAEIGGKVDGDVRIEVGLGTVDLDLVGNIDHYNISSECGLGNVNLNGQNFSGIGENQKNTYDALYNIQIECGLGSVNLNINKEN